MNSSSLLDATSLASVTAVRPISLRIAFPHLPTSSLMASTNWASLACLASQPQRVRSAKTTATRRRPPSTTCQIPIRLRLLWADRLTRPRNRTSTDRCTRCSLLIRTHLPLHNNAPFLRLHKTLSFLLRTLRRPFITPPQLIITRPRH